MVEQTEYDDQIDCKHSYTERCFITYKTDYTPQQQEECDENFKKVRILCGWCLCFI